MFSKLDFLQPLIGLRLGCFTNISRKAPAVRFLPPEPLKHPDRERDDPEPPSTTRLYASLQRDLSADDINSTLAHIDARIRRPYEFTGLGGKIGLHRDLEVEGEALELEDFFGHVVVRLEVPGGDVGLRQDLDAIPTVLAVDEEFQEVLDYCLADM